MLIRACRGKIKLILIQIRRYNTTLCVLFHKKKLSPMVFLGKMRTSTQAVQTSDLCYCQWSRHQSLQFVWRILLLLWLRHIDNLTTGSSQKLVVAQRPLMRRMLEIVLLDYRANEWLRRMRRKLRKIKGNESTGNEHDSEKSIDPKMTADKYNFVIEPIEGKNQQ